MRLVAEPGAWTVGPPVSDAPALAVLEVSGAILAWTVDDAAAGPRITITDVVAADWLWRVVGSSGHASISAALAGRLAHGSVDVIDVELLPSAVDPLRRLAVGHWLRRWWPESARDGIVGLDRAILDGELALLTTAAEEFFTEDTLDSDVDGLLAPHRAALLALEQHDDPRVRELARSCELLAEEVGSWPGDMSEGGAASLRRRDDYALAAGPGTVRPSGAIARGVDSVNWTAVPPGIFDAAEQTIEWSVSAADDEVLATVRVATTGRTGVRGIEVRLRCGAVRADGLLDANGVVAMVLRDVEERPLTETLAWDLDWSAATVAVGPDVTFASDPAAARELRRRVRNFARARLARPGPEAFLAESMAGESDY